MQSPAHANVSSDQYPSIDPRELTGPLLNHYVLIKKLGRGTHGSVTLARDLDNNGVHVAIKGVKRKNKHLDRQRQLIQNSQKRSGKAPVANTIASNELKIRREIALMRRLDHPHIVRLLDVLDDPLRKKVFIVVEYMGGGEIEWRTPSKKPVQTVLQATRIVRDVMLGLRYLHLQGIVHRDIKPANLLWSTDRMTVKISDFGVSLYTFAPKRSTQGLTEEEREFADLMNDDFLNRLAGTPAFLAPELCYKGESQLSISNVHSNSQTSMSNFEVEPPTKFAIDVWALGVTYYCVLFGHPPWQGTNEFHIYRQIAHDDFEIPEIMGSDRLPTGGRHPTDRQLFPDGVEVNTLLSGLLQKDPQKRLTLTEMKKIPYVTKDIEDLSRWRHETAIQAGEPIRVTDEETRTAVNPVRWRNKVSSGFDKIKSKFRRQNKASLVYTVHTPHFDYGKAPSSPLTKLNFSKSSKVELLHTIDGTPPVHLPPPLLKPCSHKHTSPSSSLHLPPSRNIPPANCRPQKMHDFDLKSPFPTTQIETVALKDKDGRLLFKPGLFPEVGTSDGRSFNPAFHRLDTVGHGVDFRVRRSDDGFWSVRNGEREMMSAGQATLAGYEVEDSRRVLSDGDCDSLSQGLAEDWSSDDYGETENDKQQRLLVGAGGLLASVSSGALNPGIYTHTTTSNSPIVHPIPQPLYVPSQMPSTSDPTFRGTSLQALRQRTASPLRQPSFGVNDDDDADDEHGSVEDSDSEQEGPRLSVYSGSEQSESETDLQAPPLELKLRRLTISSPESRGERILDAPR